MTVKVAVIGAGPAGLAAASRIKKLRPDYHVVVFEKTRWASFALCGTPYYIGGLIDKPEKLMHYPPRFFIEKRGIDLRLIHRVIYIDPDKKILEYEGPGGTGRYEWDVLLIASGARADLPDVPGIDLQGVYKLHHIDDAVLLREKIEGENVKDIVIIGSGYIGLELAENLQRIGKRVIIPTRSKYPLTKLLDPDMGEKLANILREKGLVINYDESLEEIKRKNDRLEIVTSKNTYTADAVIVATGIKPNTEIAEALGLRTGNSGAIIVDSMMKTSRPDIYAAGDNVEVKHVVTDKYTWAPFAQEANKEGYVAGSNIAGKTILFPGVAGTSVTSVKGVVIAGTGLTMKEAYRHGFKPIAAYVEARTKPAYMPGSGKVLLKVIADKKTGLLLGAQAIGGEDAYWRINVVAALLHKRGVVEDLFFTDLGYAPPVNTVWDALVIAGRILLRNW
ncbi:MAG: FAD-dependent oxidoreductase [Crenarchaeota archaeon]|nr:FAD-dependent oxidoreductase [Thermoproteota archaeon]